MVILVQNIKWSRGSMDRAFDYGSKGWGFESLRGRYFWIKRGIITKYGYFLMLAYIFY